MKRLLIITFASVFMLGASPTAKTKSAYDGIALVVNNQAITYGEVHQRMVLLAANLGLELEQIADRVRQEIIQDIIGEKLKLLHAARNGISVSEDEINAAIDDIETNNNLERGKFLERVASLGISEEAIRAQIKARVMWQKYVKFNLSPRINISTEEVDTRLSTINSRIGMPEYDYAEIFIPYGEDKNAANIFLDKLAEIILKQETAERKSLLFARIARQHSHSASAGKGGAMGWSVADLLSPQKAQTLEQTALGDISEIVEDGGGFYLLLLKGSRVIGKKGKDKFTLKQFNGVNGDAEPTQILAQIKKGDACANTPTGLVVQEFENLSVGSLAPTIEEAIGAVENTKDAAFIAKEQVYKVCDYTAAEIIEVSKQEIANQIANERLDKIVQQTVRSLFRSAYVDVRI